MTALPFRARCFGIDWAADVALPQFDPADSSENPPDVEIRRIEQLPDRTAVTRIGRGLAYRDGFRFSWMDTAVFDVDAGTRINYLPGGHWHGVMPAAFYSTVAALMLACRGDIAFHATALELDGRAVLLAGAGGAGKSTLAAELLGAGVRFISDDLTVLRQTPADGSLGVVRGRPAMRLHPLTAAAIDGTHREDVPEDPRGKILVRPAQRAADRTWPLAALVMLSDRSDTPSASEALRLLPPLLFRPQWMSVLPGQGRRQAHLLALASQLRVVRLPRISGFDAESRRRRVGEFFAALSR